MKFESRQPRSDWGFFKRRFWGDYVRRLHRRSKSRDALLPVLYQRGISTGDFQQTLSALLVTEAPTPGSGPGQALSPNVISRLTGEWQKEYDRWQRRDLSARRYVYIWADGVYLQARMEPQAACMLVILGATPEGKKELVGLHVGVRDSAQMVDDHLHRPRPELRRVRARRVLLPVHGSASFESFALRAGRRGSENVRGHCSMKDRKKVV